MKAARYGKTNTIVELVEAGADINMRNLVCCLFLHLTLLMRHLYLVRLSFITQDGNTALILASRGYVTEVIVQLVKAGANVNLQNNVC